MLTHRRFRQRDASRNRLGSVSVGRRPTNLSAFSSPFIDSIESKRAKTRFRLIRGPLSLAYFSPIFLFIRRHRETVDGARFPAFSTVINDSRSSSLSPSLYARPISRTRTRHCDIRDYLGLIEVCGRYRARVQPRSRGPLVADWDRSFRLPIVHTGSRSQSFKKLSLSLTFRATSIVYRTIWFAFPFFFSRFFFFFLRWFQ